MKYLLRFGKIQEVLSTDRIEVGVTVELETTNGQIIYTIVGEHESNPADKKISHKSPLGSLLLGKKVGESVSITTPTGQKTYKITKLL